MSFAAHLHSRIFDPLEMRRSWMPYRSHPAVGPEMLRPAYLDGTDVSTSRSVTAEWAGGGIASTEEDLLRFSRALWSDQLISTETRAHLTVFGNRFISGINYGKGMMQYDFGGFFFVLRSYPRLAGHMGILATHVFCNREHDLHIVLNLGSSRAMPDSVRLIIRIVGLVRQHGLARPA